MAERFSLKTIKRILKNYYQGEISGDVYVYIRDIIEEKLQRLINDGLKEFEEINNKRKKQGLPKFKRLNLSAFINVKYLTSRQIRNNGIIGQSNSELLCREKEAIEVI